MEEDIRWMQRFEHFKTALTQLENALQIDQPSVVERAGIIQIFEFSAELAWNTLRDLLEYQGERNITGSRDAINMAFRNGLIGDGSMWLNMIKSRNLSSHIYNESIAREILADIRLHYYSLLAGLLQKLETISNQDKQD